MSTFGAIIDFFKMKSTPPMPYGWFHIVFFLLSLVVGVWLCVKYKNVSETRTRRILLIMSLICIALEIVKQITLNFSCVDGRIIFDYKWHIFPWQFCSTPMYVALLAALTSGKWHHRFTAYLASYSFFAGLSVMVYPHAVLIDHIWVNVQTMICHGSMLTISIYLVMIGYVKTDIKTIFNALPVFLTTLIVAVTLNEIAFRVGILEHGVFNMFYISPYCEPVIPILSYIQENCPFPIPQIVYGVCFTLIAYLVLLMFRGIKLLVAIIEKKR